MIEVIKLRGGKTGNEIHIGSPTSSVTQCGIWLKHNLIYFKSNLPISCDKCKKLMEKRNYKII